MNENCQPNCSNCSEDNFDNTELFTKDGEIVLPDEPFSDEV